MELSRTEYHWKGTRHRMGDTMIERSKPVNRYLNSVELDSKKIRGAAFDETTSRRDEWVRKHDLAKQDLETTDSLVIGRMKNSLFRLTDV